MKFTSLPIVFAAFAIVGCAGNKGDPAGMPGGRSTDSPIVNSPQAPAVDQNLNNHNGSGAAGSNQGSSSPAGGDPQMSGH